MVKKDFSPSYFLMEYGDCTFCVYSTKRAKYNCTVSYVGGEWVFENGEPFDSIESFETLLSEHISKLVYPCELYNPMVTAHSSSLKLAS